MPLSLFIFNLTSIKFIGYKTHTKNFLLTLSTFVECMSLGVIEWYHFIYKYISRGVLMGNFDYTATSISPIKSVLN